jgi:beta-1,4-mannosyl-glycoprotein beta-1,4-N-acetylglucosaminyltransferase
MKTVFETKELYEKVKEERTKYSLIILVIAHYGETYDLFSECWREYMNDFPGVKAYFLYADPTIEPDIMVKENSIICKTNGHYDSRIFQKTISAMTLCQKYFEYNYILRTNLSSFVHIPRLMEFLAQQPTENYIGAHYHQLPPHISQRCKQNQVNAYFGKTLNERFIYLHGAAFILSNDIVVKLLLEVKTNYKKIESIISLPDDLVISMTLYNFLTFDENIDNETYYHPREFRNLIEYKLDCSRLIDTKYYSDTSIFHIRNKVNDLGTDNSVEARSVDIMNYIRQIRHFYDKPRFMDYIDGTPVKKMIDAFTFQGDLKMLEYRLTVLNPIVNMFIIVESTRTYTGETKPLYYLENQEQFSQFQQKIRYITVDDFSLDPADTQKNETYLRNCINRGIENLGLDDTDYIMISDVCEIPDPDSIAELVQEQNHIQFANMKQDVYYYNLSSRLNESWIQAKVLNYNAYLREGSSPDAIRQKTAPEILLNGGWCLSYFGSAEMVQRTLRDMGTAVSEDIVDMDNIKKRIENSEDILGRDGVEITNVPVSENPNLPPMHEKWLTV